MQNYRYCKLINDLISQQQFKYLVFCVSIDSIYGRWIAFDNIEQEYNYQTEKAIFKIKSSLDKIIQCYPNVSTNYIYRQSKKSYNL